MPRPSGDLLAAIDLPSEAEELRPSSPTRIPREQKREKAVKRLEVVDAFLKGGNSPANMILDVIPVIPPDLRPMVSSTAAASPRPTSTIYIVARSTVTTDSSACSTWTPLRLS